MVNKESISIDNDLTKDRNMNTFKTYCKRRKSGARLPDRKANNRLCACHCIAGNVTCPSGETETGEQIRKGGGGSSADQVQTKKAAVTPVYSPALCLDGVAATARLSLDDLGDRVPPLGAGVLHMDNCAGGQGLRGAGVFVVLGCP